MSTFLMLAYAVFAIMYRRSHAARQPFRGACTITQSRSLRSSRPFFFMILHFTIGAQFLFGALHVV